MAEIISNGISDTQLYLQAAANVSAPFSITPSSGQYPAVGNTLVNRRLADQWQLLYLDSKIFVDGLGITSMNATEDGAVAVRIPQLLPPPRNMRTLSVNLGAGGTLAGTPGNDQPFNNNLPHGMQTNAVDVWFRQLYDEAAQISRSQMRMIGNRLDLLGQYTANIPAAVGLLTDADVMATQLGSALARANNVSNSNIVFYNSATTTTGYLQGVLNALAAKLSNVQGGYVDGVISYPVEKSVFVMRYSLFNQLMTISNGAIINSDIGQQILINGKFSADGSRYLGGAIRGEYGGIYIKVVPDELWIMAAALNGIPTSALAQWNKVSAYIANGAGTYFGRASVVTEVDKSPTTSIGFIVRNDWQWGVTVTRPTSIALLVDSTNNGTDFTNPITSFNGTVSPRDLEASIQSYYSALPSAGTIQAIGVSPSTLITDVTLTVKNSSSNITDASLVVVDDSGASVSWGNNGDGTYSFTLNRGSTATVTITAPGYNTATLNVTTGNTALATVALQQVLTEAD